jgi:hypothetical protein
MGFLDFGNPGASEKVFKSIDDFKPLNLAGLRLTGVQRGRLTL